MATKTIISEREYRDAAKNIYGWYWAELTYTRSGNNMVYYVTGYSRSRPGWNVNFIGDRTVSATINGVTKSGTVPTPPNGGTYSATIGPWTVPIYAASDTTLPGTGSVTFVTSDTFAVPVLAGGTPPAPATLPLYINVNGTLRKVQAVYLNVNGAIKTCTVYVNVGGNLKAIT